MVTSVTTAILQNPFVERIHPSICAICEFDVYYIEENRLLACVLFSNELHSKIPTRFAKPSFPCYVFSLCHLDGWRAENSLILIKLHFWTLFGFHHWWNRCFQHSMCRWKKEFGFPQANILWSTECNTSGCGVIERKKIILIVIFVAPPLVLISEIIYCVKSHCSAILVLHFRFLSAHEMHAIVTHSKQELWAWVFTA